MGLIACTSSKPMQIHTKAMPTYLSNIANSMDMLKFSGDFCTIQFYLYRAPWIPLFFHLYADCIGTRQQLNMAQHWTHIVTQVTISCASHTDIYSFHFFHFIHIYLAWFNVEFFQPENITFLALHRIVIILKLIWLNVLITYFVLKYNKL